MGQGELGCKDGGLVDRALLEKLAQILRLGGGQLPHAEVGQLRYAQRNWPHVE